MNKYMLLVASAVLAVGAVQAADNQQPNQNGQNFQPQVTPQAQQADQMVGLTLADLMVAAAGRGRGNGTIVPIAGDENAMNGNINIGGRGFGGRGGRGGRGAAGA